METNTSEPPFKCRKRREAIKTRRESLAWDKSGRNLITDQTVTGMKVARTSHRLLYGTWEPTPPMIMEKSKRRPREDESTDAEDRGGSTRSSEEPTKKVGERRG